MRHYVNNAENDMICTCLKLFPCFFSRPKKDSRLFVDEDDEKIPLVNGEKRTKRV